VGSDFSSSPSSLHPVSTPQAVAHGGGCGCHHGGPQVLSVIVCHLLLLCHSLFIVIVIVKPLQLVLEAREGE
jgi:hypothetical protein